MNYYFISIFQSLVSIADHPLIILPIIAFMLSRFEKRNENRGKARDKFNMIILEGLGVIGKLAVISAYKLKNQDVNGGLDKAIEGYEDYECKVERFKRENAAEVVGG